MASKPDPIVFHIINTTASAGARIRLSGAALRLLADSQMHCDVIASIGRAWRDACRIVRQRRAVAA